MSIEVLDRLNGKPCPCGKTHRFDAEVVIGEGVISRVPEFVKKLGGKKVFMLSDKNTYAAAGEKVLRILSDAGIAFVSYTFEKEELEPDESNVGLAFMHYELDCDLILAVGSGVINDISKIVAAVSKNPYIIVGTTPSMDGYASATSSMTRAGFKLSLNSKCADVIIGDVDILCEAPMKTMVSGLGDVLAKYVSICEWRIAHLLVDEYYCEEIASLVRGALKKCVDNADGLLKRDKQAVTAVFEGLVVSGVAMNYAGLSRPASGVEHYFSHIWDMRYVSFGAPMDYHGIQCGIGTLAATRLYEKLLALTPDREKALKYAEDFDYADWSEKLKDFLGAGADSMIALEAKEGKYDKDNHKVRLSKIIEHWEDIRQIAKEELLPAAAIENLLDSLQAPKEPADIGIDNALLPMTFYATKDIRNKYGLARLAWDLGVLEELI